MLMLICPSENTLQENNIWVGSQSASLTEAGRFEAEDIDKINHDRAYVAPQDQFQEFARIVLAKPFEVVDALTDRSMGTLTDRSYRETLNEFPRRNWLLWKRSYWDAAPEGESFFDISDRVITSFRTRILPVRSGETVVIICAADIMRVLLGYLTRIEETEIPKIDIQPSVPYVINGDLG